MLLNGSFHVSWDLLQYSTTLSIMTHSVPVSIRQENSTLPLFYLPTIKKSWVILSDGQNNKFAKNIHVYIMCCTYKKILDRLFNKMWEVHIRVAGSLVYWTFFYIKFECSVYPTVYKLLYMYLHAKGAKSHANID